MADSYSVKKITELTENTTSHDTDLFVLGNEGTATMRKVTFANLANWVKTKINALVSSDIVNNATTSDSNKVASAAVAKSLQDQITTLNSKTQLTVTRVAQNYVTAESLSRCVAYKRGTTLCFYCNLEVVYAAAFTGFVKIATISGWASPTTAYQNIPSQSDGSKVVVLYVNTSGEVYIYSATSFGGSPFFRGTITAQTT